MRIQYNHVLIVPEEKLTVENAIVLSDAFDPMKHVAVTGKVVCTAPLRFEGSLYEQFKFAPHGIGSQYTQLTSLVDEVSMPWATDMEVNIGDEVLFHYVNHLVAQDDFTVFNVGGEDAILVPYHQLYCKLDPVMPLNGYLLIEPLEKEQGDIYIFRDERSRDSGVGVVKFSGSPRGRTLHEDLAGGQHYDVGQKVLYDLTAPTIEYKYHQRLNPTGKPLVRAQANEIVAVVS